MRPNKNNIDDSKRSNNKTTKQQRTGLMTPQLQAFLLAWRSVLPMDTQNLEGINSVIQVMCKRAPHMGVALLNARLSIKKNMKQDARFLAENDSDVTEYMKAPLLPLFAYEVFKVFNQLNKAMYNCSLIINIMHSFNAARRSMRDRGQHDFRQSLSRMMS